MAKCLVCGVDDKSIGGLCCACGCFVCQNCINKGVNAFGLIEKEHNRKQRKIRDERLIVLLKKHIPANTLVLEDERNQSIEKAFKEVD